jgi:SAM-dependent methyltransferase
MWTTTSFDFGYSWWMAWGHLIPLVVFALLAGLAWYRAWRWWAIALPALVALWALSGFVIMTQVLAVRQPLTLPTPRFLPSGTGRVLDMGAGSGRATLMVALARPSTQVVATDIYEGYWGIDDNTPERLHRNAAAAGVTDRVDVRVADMRALPFADASFDGAVSSFAIDHLNRDDRRRALAEAARVLREGGHLLIMNLALDLWVRVALPTPPGHGYFGHQQDAVRWRRDLADAGFDVIEEGTRPATVYFLATRRAP